VNPACVKDWEIIADNLHKAGWSLGWVSAVDAQERTMWIVDAHRDDGKRFIVRADEILTVFGTGSAIPKAIAFIKIRRRLTRMPQEWY